MWLVLILVGIAMIVFGVLVEAAQLLIWLGVILAAVSSSFCGSSGTSRGPERVFDATTDVLVSNPFSR